MQLHLTDGFAFSHFTVAMRSFGSWLMPIPVMNIGEAPMNADFLEIARLQRPHPLLYHCFPLTCARSQE
jgi:hypothetical protein